MSHYEVIVLGTGGVGSAALYHAASRGLKTLGLDRFPPGHDRGSSHGESRLIRMSYFEHPEYVPLLRRSYQMWDDLDPELLHRCGVFYAGEPGSEIINGVRAAAQRYHLPLQEVSSADFPQYLRPADADVVFEPDAGWLPVERCVERHLEAAIAAGAEHRWGESVINWSVSDRGVEVVTDQASYRGERLVIAGGAWNGELLDGLELPLQVTRKHVHWYDCPDKRYQNGFFMDLPQGQFYGFPCRDGRLKLGEHSGGDPVSDPLTASRDPDPNDVEKIENFIRERLPGVGLTPRQHSSCFYTITPDADFIVDKHSRSSRVSYAAGLSGHGFKFTPVLGEVLVDLVVQGGTDLDIEFLGAERRGLSVDSRAAS